MVQANGFSFSRFKNEMKSAARGNQFRIEINLPPQIRQFVPNYAPIQDSISFKAKAGSIPAMTLDPIPLSFRGRKCTIAGDRTLEPWNVSIYATNGLPERKFFETWQDAILGVDDASRAPDADVDYMADGSIYQLNQNGVIQAAYTFEGIWPQSIGEVSFDFDNGELIMVDITFEMQNIQTKGIRG